MVSILQRWSWHTFSIVTTRIGGHANFAQVTMTMTMTMAMTMTMTMTMTIREHPQIFEMFCFKIPFFLSSQIDNSNWYRFKIVKAESSPTWRGNSSWLQKNKSKLGNRPRYSQKEGDASKRRWYSDCTISGIQQQWWWQRWWIQRWNACF